MQQKEFKNLSELVFYQANNFDSDEFLNFKNGDGWYSFSNLEFFEDCVYFALALIKNGFQPGAKLAIYSYQSPIWMIADFATLMAGGASVPIFHNVSKDNLLFQLQDSGVEVVFADCSDDFEEKNNFNKIDILANDLPDRVKNVICCDFKIDQESRVNIIDFEDFLRIGREEFEKKKVGSLKTLLEEEDDLDTMYRKIGLPLVKSSDLASIVYTSGSTGKPKGVRISHENLVSQIGDATRCFDLDCYDRILSFLPLAHIFERMVMMFYVSKGCCVYFVDDVAKLGDFMREVKPNMLTVVPRVLEKVFAKINEKSQTGSFLKRKFAMASIKRALSKDVTKRRGVFDYIYDLIVYSKYREALGGNVRLMICGGAALSNDMERFYRNIGINLYCGYGLTETSPVLAVNYDKNYKFGSVGKKFFSTELKVSQEGELMARGKNIMLGYHNNDEGTRQVMDDGWFKTGDLAQIDEDGYVTITGRKKELFKTANGKYVRPVPIEQALVHNLGFLIGAMIIAEGKKCAAVLLFPDFELLDNLKYKLNFSGDNQEFLSSEVLNKFVSKKIDDLNGNLDRGEQIFKFKIIADQISINNGDITPSMKLRRPFLEDKYSKEIESLYQG